MTTGPPIAPDDPTPRAPSRFSRKPVITGVLCAVCIAVFAAITVHGGEHTWESLEALGYVPPMRIWDGAYWGLVSSVFVHLALWHVAFNVYWFWTLGGLVERQLGPARYVGFVLVAAVVSSGVQLGVSGSTGHGASGVVYAFFGFMWGARRHVPAFLRRLDGQTAALFWMWLVGCIVATQMGIAQIGNGAHVGGLVLGLLAAQLQVAPTKRKLVAVATGLVVVLSLVPLFWSPWSAEWVGYNAYKAHAAGDYDTAVAHYRRSIELGGPRLWALENVALIHQARGAQEKLKATLAEIRAVDPAAAARFEAETEGTAGNDPPGRSRLNVSRSSHCWGRCA